MANLDVSCRELESLITSWIFSERDRKLVHRRLVDGVRFEPLAEEFGLSVTQAKRIVYKCTQTILSKCW